MQAKHSRKHESTGEDPERKQDIVCLLKPDEQRSDASGLSKLQEGQIVFGCKCDLLYGGSMTSYGGDDCCRVKRRTNLFVYRGVGGGCSKVGMQ